MNLYLRLLWVLIAGLRGPRIAPLGTSRIRLPVLPGDLDLHGHVNNGRTMTLLDLGRVDLTLRAGFGRGIYGGGLRPMVASAIVRFRREIKLGQVVEVTTRVLGWDDRWMYLEHRILRADGEVATAAIIKSAVLGPAGRVDPSGLATLMGVDESPPLPDAIRSWQEAERALLSSGAA